MLPQRWWCLSSHNLAKWVVFSGKLYLSSLLTVHIMCTNYIEQSALRYAFFMINVFTIYWYLQEMDTRQFYGRKEHDRAVRVIPSENEDSEVEESHEDWIPESGLRDSLEVRGQLGVSQQSIMCVCAYMCVCLWSPKDDHQSPLPCCGERIQQEYGWGGSSWLTACTVSDQNQIKEVVTPAGVPPSGYDHRDHMAALPTRLWRYWHEKEWTYEAVYLQILHCWSPMQKWKKPGVQERSPLFHNCWWVWGKEEKRTRCSNSSPWCAPGCHSPLDDYGWKEGEMQGTRVHRYTKSQVPEMWCSPLFYIHQQLLSEVSHRIGNQSMLCQKEKLWFKQYPKNHTNTHSHTHTHIVIRMLVNI